MVIAYTQTLYRPVLAVNDKWNDVLRGIAEREVSWGEFVWICCM